MSGLFGSHGSVKTDRTSQLQSFSDLNNVFNFALPTAQGEQKKGDANLDSALSSLGLSSDYFQKILSGNRTDVAQAVAPTTNAITERSDAEKRQAASLGTARGGGAAGENQQVQDKTNAAVDTTIAQARPDAAKANADIASKIAGVGGERLSAALSALGIGTNAAGTLGQIATGAKKDDNASQQATGQAIGEIAMMFLGL
jgi:hypothetical protein